MKIKSIIAVVIFSLFIAIVLQFINNGFSPSYLHGFVLESGWKENIVDENKYENYRESDVFVGYQCPAVVGVDYIGFPFAYSASGCPAGKTNNLALVLNYLVSTLIIVGISGSIYIMIKKYRLKSNAR